MITDYNYNYFWSGCNWLQLQLLYKSNHDYFMITYGYFLWITLLHVGEYITVHVSSLHNLQRNEYEWKEICKNKWFKFCNIHYTPDIRSMWGYIVFAFPFVHSFVGSFVFPSQGQSFCVKVYKTSYFEDPLMDFIRIWHDGRCRSKVFICTIPIPGVTLESRSRT